MKTIARRIAGVKVNYKKIISSISIVTLVVNILAPSLTYASLPNYNSSVFQPNVLAVAQQNEITLPRDLVPGDNLSLTISGITLTQNFNTDSLTTAGLFNTQIDALPEVTSVFGSGSKKFTITSETPWVPFAISNLTITRSPIVPTTTVANVVAVAQVSEVNMPQALFTGDVINFTLGWVGVTTNFAIDKNTTLTNFANQITALTSANGVYDNVNNKVVMTAKVAGQAFTMSNFVITSNGIVPANIQPNIVPVAQVDTINFPRPIYSDETIHLTISGTTINQPFNTDFNTTLNSLSLQADALNNVNSNYTGGIITVTSSTPGIAFGTGNVTINGWTVNAVNIIPNVIAVAQQDVIAVPRDLVMWDSVKFTLGGTTLTQWFGGTSNGTILNLIAQIDALPWVFVSNYNPWLRAITVQSETPGTAFAHPSLYISTSFNSTNQVANQVPQTQVTEYNFPRNLVAGDNVSAIINGSPYNTNYAVSSAATITSFANLINASLSGTITVTTGVNKITLTSKTAGVGFTTQPLQISNTLTPQVLVANVVPVKQRDIAIIATTLVAGDTITVTIDGTLITQAFNTNENNTLTLLNNQINAQPNVTSNLVLGTKTFTIDAKNAGTAFTISNIVTTWSNIASNNTQANQAETKARLSFDIIGIPTTWESIQVGNCIVSFTAWAWTENDCSDNVANIDTTWIVDFSTVATLIKWLVAIQDPNQWSLTGGWIGANVVFSSNTTPNNLANVHFHNNTAGRINNINYTAPVIPVAQINTLTLPRNFAQWDTFQTVINWITVTQNFLSDATTSLNNLVTQINNLPWVSAGNAGNVITITSETAGVAFTIASASFVNTLTPSVTITNVSAVAQQEEIDFPVAFVAGDTIDISISGTSVSENFNTNSATTINNLIANITANTAVTASLSGALGIVLQAKVAGTSFSVDSVNVSNTTAVNPVQANVPWIAQVESLTLPFTPATWDDLSVNINGTIVNQTFNTDVFTTLSALNTKIDALAPVNSSVNTASGIFTITSAVAGTPFTASFLSTGATINSTTAQANVASGAQVDNLVVNRNLSAWDVLTLNIAGQTLTQNFNTNKATTLAALNTQIDNLAEVSSIFDGNSTFTITATTPGTPFVSWVLTIVTTYTSQNQVANVPAQAQIDRITLPRNLIAGDKLDININWNNATASFSGDMNNTLGLFAIAINAAQTWTTASIAGNQITFTATTAWVPFTITPWSFKITNTTLGNTTTNNVVAVKQEVEFAIPTFVVWDTLFMSINGNNIITNYNTSNIFTIGTLTGQINTIGTVTSDFVSSSGVIHMISNTAWIPYAVSNISIINITPAVQTIANVVPVAQVIDMYPSGTLREWITFRTTVDGTDYDYLTTPTDWIPEIINWIINNITSTWVVISTWSDLSGNFVRLTAIVPWMPFTYNSQAIDITAPTISTPINTQQILRSWVTSTSTVEINEDWEIYMVLTWTTVNNSVDIATAISNNQAFIAKTNALSHISYTVQVPVGIVDWKYNIVAMDQYNNITSIYNWWLTVDNTPPVVTITTPAQIVNTNTIVINWNTEPNRPLQITWWNWIVNTTSDWAWAFSWIVTLNQNVSNTLLVTTDDVAGNIWTGSVIIIHDDLTPQPFIISVPAYTNSWAVDVSINTESWILAEIFSWATLVGSGITNGSWDIVLNIPLALNTSNNFHVVVTDSWSNTNSWDIVIVQDSINPNIIITPLPALIHAPSVNITWTTESFATVVVDNSWVTNTWVADNLGAFNINIVLNPNSTNTIHLTATDLAGNIGTGTASTYEDSTPNTLLISTPSQFTKNPTITVTGSTKPNSTVNITGWQNLVVATLDWAGNFTGAVNLNLNIANNLLITSTDQVGNILTWAIVVTHDTVNPIINITTPNTPTNNTTINLVGTTEPNSTISISGWSGAFNWVSDWSWAFNIPVNLNIWALNNLVIIATDQAGNMGSTTFAITHVPVVNFMTIGTNALNYTNSNIFSFTGQTKPNLAVLVTGWSGNLNLVADNSGDFSWTITLIPNSQNNIVVSSTDNTLTTATWWFIVNQDNVAPTLTFSPYSGLVNTANITFTGTTEALATVTLNNWTSNITSQASSTWSFNITFPLIPNIVNNIVATSIDLAMNSSTWVNLTVTHDNTAPVASWLLVTQTPNGPVMNANYSFITNENSTSVFYLGTNSNVLANLVYSGTTNGLNHAGLITGLTPNTTYYYFITNTDLVWNTFQTTVASINNIDNVGPAIISKNITNITDSWARLDFSYTDSFFNSWTLASWSILLNGGGNSVTVFPTINYWNGTLTWGIDFTTLNSWTNYNYTLSLFDDFGNSTTSIGGFLTSNTIVLTGSTTVATWSVTLPTQSWSLTTSWAIIIISDPNTSWILSWSLNIPGGTNITSSWAWNWTITAPVLVDPNSPQAATNSEIAHLVTPLNTPTMTYSGNVQQTVFVGNNNATIIASGWLFSITVSFTNNLVWQNLRIYRSQDGNSWINNIPTNTCTVSSNNTCTFLTDTLGYFSFATIIGTTINNPPATSYSSWGGGGGWWWGSTIQTPTSDYCPGWDYSWSSSDGKCTKTQQTSSWSGLNNISSWTILNNFTGSITPNNISQIANKYLLEVKKNNYDLIKTIDQKIDLWKKVIEEMKNKIDNTTDPIKKKLYENIKSKAEKILDTIIKEAEQKDKIIDTTKKDEYVRENEDKDETKKYFSPIQYINVEHTVVIRQEPSYRSEVIAYLPRNLQVEVLDYWEIWSKIKYLDWKIGYIRTTFLREENQYDRWRTVSILVFYNTSLQTWLDMRKTKVARSLFVRKWPWVDNEITWVLKKWDPIIMLDNQSINGWFEIRWLWGTWFVNGKYLEEKK